MNTLRLVLAVVGLATLLAGCASVAGDADVGPDPGGGFYYGSNINVGHINPAPGDLYYHPYTSLGQLHP
jgi:uncharacterized protein YceK